ncbi:GntR family transcriptional regulator [Rhodoglobus vestalii]|uniref:GntR family transcriptional regulator n=1 Tax=Rhodoglobus vestalii TaxID=193384 RepID=A0A8H2K5U2_9MICO|nr:GntR family transcriptional regulator [Rhodoglobus vestalii]TQO19454.1 GntR family transcriptional regulator [Rhodoglobus vestalii]
MITIDQSLATPVFEQIRGQIAQAIRSGGLDAGARLPSIRQLAADLRVAPGTVARAFTELEIAGLISSDRRGARVEETDVASDDLRAAAARFIGIARSAAIPLEDALSMISAGWAGVHERG